MHYADDCAATWPIVNSIKFCVLNKLAYNSGCKVDLKSAILLMQELMFRAGVNERAK